jgi:hypothetical protein
LSLAFSYWIDNLGFVTEGKLAAIFIKPSLGVSNWPIIYIINYTPISFLAPFNTAPSGSANRKDYTEIKGVLDKAFNGFVAKAVRPLKKQKKI